MYKYKVTVKGIFPRPFTSEANTKQEIEAATGMTISNGIWNAVENGKKGIVEDEYQVLIIEKVKDVKNK